MNDYIVTGGTGFIGRNLIKRLLKENKRVYAVVRPDSRNISFLPKDDNIIVVKSDIGEISQHKDELPKECEAVFHFAWGGVNREELGSDVIQKKNVDDSLELLDTALEKGCKKFVFAGSRSEYGVQSGVYTEDLDCHPIVAYGKAKLDFGNIAYDTCSKGGMKFLHARIFSVYGPDDHPWSLVSSSVNKMLNNEKIDLSECLHYWNYMYIDDTVDLLYEISRKSDRIPNNDNCIFNVATRDIRPLKEYVEEIKRVTGSNSLLNYGAYKQSAESAVSLLPDMSKVEKLFDWKSNVSFSEGIENIIRYMEAKNA